MDSYLDSLQREFVQAILESHSDNSIDLQVAIQLAVVPVSTSASATML